MCHTVPCQIANLVDQERPHMKPKAQKAISAVIGIIGLTLLVMMITTEGEPGALPLGLVLIGAVGYVTGRLRENSLRLQ